MGSDRVERLLGEVYDFRSGLSKPASAFGSGHPFLTFKDVFYNYFVPDELGDLVNSTEAERDSCDIKRGDVFLTRTSETMEELGMSCVALRDIPFATFNGFSKRLRPKRDAEIVPEFAGYFFRSPQFRRDVTAMSSMSTRASLNNDMLSQLKIALPHFTTQLAIGKTLKALDDKIEQNRRTARALERLARAIFRAWFVDFEPVKAKAAGATAFPSMPQPVFDALPTRFVDSDIGPVPEGWAVVGLPEAMDFLEGPGLRNWQYRDKGMKFLNIRCINDGDLNIAKANSISLEEFEKTYSHFALHEDDIVISTSGTLGRLAIVRDEHLPVMLNTSIIRMRGCGSVGLAYVWCFLQSQFFISEMFALAAGSVQLNFGPMHLRQIPFLRPPVDVLESFERVARQILKKCLHLRKESGKLAAMRDYLLPKLLSGAVRVKEAERIMENTQ